MPESGGASFAMRKALRAGLISGRYRNTIRGLWRVHAPGAPGGNKWAPRIVYRRRFRGTRRTTPGRSSMNCHHPKEEPMSKEQSKKTETASRRKFLAGAAAATAGAATLGFPMIAKGQAGPISMRWQSTWPSKDIFHEYALDFAKKVNDMTGGDLKIEVLPAGSVVPAFGLLDAVSKGTLDGGHGVLVYHYGKQNALALWGSSPAYAMDANMLLSWHKYGGGKELLNKLYASIGANVVSFPYGPSRAAASAWFK